MGAAIALRNGAGGRRRCGSDVHAEHKRRSPTFVTTEHGARPDPPLKRSVRKLGP